MNGPLLVLPTKKGLYVEPARLLEVIACFTGMPNPMHRDLDELQIFFDIQHPTTDYYRFHPTDVFANGQHFVLRGKWRERVTDPGETWEPGCLFVARNEAALYYTPALLYHVDDFVSLQRPRVVVST